MGVESGTRPTSWKGPSTPAEHEAHAAFVQAGLPVDLPCNAPSYLVQKVESGDTEPGVSCTAMFKSQVLWDLCTVFFAILSGLLAMYAAVFRTLDQRMSGIGFLLFVFAAGYPIVMMFLLLTRSNDMSLRKEGYYLLLKYKCLMDWNNWVWWSEDGSDYVIWKHSCFFFFWLATMFIQVIYAIINNGAYTEKGCPSKTGWIVVIVVFLQVIGLFGQFYATLKVEESGIITLNKFFENKKGKLVPDGVEEYVDSGPLRDRPVVIVAENYIKKWAVVRYSESPSTVEMDGDSPLTCFIANRTGSEQYKNELSKWRQIAQGDLQALRGVTEPTWTKTELNPIANWVYQRIWGYCLVEVLRRHPDFAPMRPALAGLININKWKVIFSLVTAMAFECYALYLLWDNTKS